MAPGEMRWLALESNPTSFNAWSKSLGLDVAQFSFQDCYGLDDELLAWVKTPVKAVLMLFPITEGYEKARKAADGQIKDSEPETLSGVLWFPQTIANACGTFALLHALGNVTDVPLSEGPLTELFARARPLPPAERSSILATSDSLASAHSSAASEGTQTAVPDIDANVELHFVTFVEWKGRLVELDGRRKGPVDHGPIKIDLLHDAAVRVKEVVELTQSIQFNLITLSRTPADDE
ncbi:peptidase C12, ubiquitin carboxyl-terminal hydrolase 1 [Meredithblackwellia eburnea MCA 4105]